jgi:alkylation response protein AidB-like acyl-CoA dehydrogenase
VRFAPSDDALLFASTVRDLLAKECPPEVVRATWQPGAPAVPTELWGRLCEMGVLGALAPESAGGLGADEVDLVLVLEEAGRAALPGPAPEQAMVAVPALVEAGRDDDAARAAVARMVEVARTGDNMVPAMLDAVRAEATLGEICDALRAEWGVYREPARF